MNTLSVDIIEQCRNNDRRAQMQLYERYCEGMYVVAMRFLKHSAEAEDAVQEAFIKAFSKLHQYQGEVTFGAWLKRIVINKCIDCLKSKQERLTSLEENHLKVVDENYQEEWLTEETVTVETIKAAIEELPDKYRYVVMLYLLEGYDHQEISEILDIPENLSRTHLSRGKAKLLELLKESKHGTGH